MNIFEIGVLLIVVIIAAVFVVEVRSKSWIESLPEPLTYEHVHQQLVKALNNLVLEYNAINRDLTSVENRLARVEQWMKQFGQCYR